MFVFNSLSGKHCLYQNLTEVNIVLNSLTELNIVCIDLS